MHEERVHELSSRLVSISDDLGDLSMELLREAVEAGQSRPDLDRVIARARRSVDKASQLLARAVDN